MSFLDSFAPRPNIVVVGSSGGIGRSLVEALASEPHYGKLVGLSRTPSSLPGGVESGVLDFGREETIEEAAAKLAIIGPLDLIIVATGILHGDDFQPEKSIRELDAKNLQHVFSTNAIGPILVAKHFLPLLRIKHKSVFAVLSARVGSINDNRLGGWASYRASKAALNMLLKTASIEYARRCPGSIVVALHPGTVDTRLSKPFSGRVPEDKLFTPRSSAEHMLNVIGALSAEQTGSFLAWDGQQIDY
jgi:NAD(P)-dependent dehydrogenase (short-subunit alcohol dehydrogenase family)